MNGSSESGWQRSDNCMDLNSSSFLMGGNPSDSSRALNSNPSFHPAGTIRSSRQNASHDGFTPVRRGRERTLWPYINSYSSLVGSEDGAIMGRQGATTLDCNGGSLRQWLDNPRRSVDALECRDIFSQIVDIVNTAHSLGSVIQHLRPSHCVMSASNHVSFLGAVRFLDMDPLEDRSSSQTAEIKGCLLPSFSLTHPHLGSHLDIQDPQLDMKTMKDVSLGSSEACCFQSGSGQDILSLDSASNGLTGDEKHSMESSWYISPEEAAGGAISCASNVYQLGVLLFELFCTFVSLEEKSTTMENLKGRVLPPQLLLKWPREASFCLWLLHPEPTSRPMMSELLESEFLKGSRDDNDEEAIQEIQDMIEEQELLLEFFLLLQQRKLDAADSLSKTISFVSSDIEEVTKLRTDLRVKGDSNVNVDKCPSVASDLMNTSDDIRSSRSRKRVRLKSYSHSGDSSCSPKRHKGESPVVDQGSMLSKNSRLMKNFRKLESAYFLTRRRGIKPTRPPLARHSSITSDGRGSAIVSEKSCVGNPSSQEQHNEQKRSGWVNTFLEGLSKYLSFSKLNVKADLKQGDLLNSSNLVCSLSFDRDGEFFASAGVNKKIKVFEYRSILDEDRDIHYPVVEMTSGSKLSSICWNGYIKSQIASSNFDGVVQVWDATRSQIYLEMREHERRVWSIDFSMTDPTMLVSGSDDGSVKLWNINQAILFLHLVDVSFETKRSKCCHY